MPLRSGIGGFELRRPSVAPASPFSPTGSLASVLRKLAFTVMILAGVALMAFALMPNSKLHVASAIQKVAHSSGPK
jgi:hypothetical protein